MKLATAAALGLSLAATGAGAQPLVYVTNQDGASVSVIDVDRREVVRTVDLRTLGFSERARPHHVAVEPDGRTWYVSLIGEGRVLRVDAEGRLLGQAPFETPGMLALRPADGLLLVARSMTAVNPPSRVGVIRTADMAIEEMDVFFPRPHALAFHPTGVAAYTASLAIDQLAVLDVEGESATLIDVPAGAGHTAHDPSHGPMAGRMLGHLAVSPDGRWAVLSAEMSGEALVFDLSDPLRPRLERSIAVGERPWQPAFTPDGRQVFLPVKGIDAVVVLDATDWSIVRTIRADGFYEPDGAATPDGRTMVVSGSNLRGAGGRANGSVALIDIATGEVTAVLKVGRNPTGVGAARPR